jgi:hypothetical protein
VKSERKLTEAGIRAVLAETFPGTRFFVSRDPAGFGVWYWAFRVRWVEGPSFKAVRAVADEMQEAGISIGCRRDDA